MGISSPRPHGNTSPGGATPPDLVLSQHPEQETTLADLQGGDAVPGCSQLAAAPAVTIIGPGWVEKAALVIESPPPPRARRRSAKTPVGGEAGGGAEVLWGTQNLGSPRQREKTLSGLTRRKSGGSRTIQQVLPFISLRGGAANRSLHQ